jgi:hypothetical protein
MKRCLNKPKCKILWLFKPKYFALWFVQAALGRDYYFPRLLLLSSNNPNRNYDLFLSTKSSLGDFSPPLEDFLFTPKKKKRV